MTTLEQARALVAGAESIVVFSGAGMSADSGVPTFRDALSGLWSRFDPEQLATPQAWFRDRELVWAWYVDRARQVSHAQPNAGHHAIAELGSSKNVTVVTQNVDDLHERAGSEQVLHLHGSLFTPRCERCSAPYSPMPVPGADAVVAQRLTPPTCPRCGAAVRPGAVWFGEGLPEDVWLAADDAIVNADLMIVVGTSGLVMPAARLPQRAASTGSAVIDVNPDPTSANPAATLTLAMSAAQALPRLLVG